MEKLIIILLTTFLFVDCNNNNTSKNIEKSKLFADTKEIIPNNEKHELKKDSDTLIIKDKGYLLSDFIPNSWELIGLDTGYLTPYKNPIIISAYNTKILSKEPDYFLRCVVIFEKIEDELYLKEQMYNMLDYYKEIDKDEYYEIKIIDNKINISYREFPRYSGNYSFEYDNEKKDWKLIYEEYSSSGTYPIYFISFNFSKRNLTFVKRSDNIDIDTMLNVQNSIPDMFMREFQKYKKFQNKAYIKRYGEVNF